MDGETTSDLVDLIERLGKGDEAAQRRLLERAHERVVRIAATIFYKDFPVLQERHDLESVVSETWLRLASSLLAVQPRGIDDFFGLVIVKVRQVLLDMARRQLRADHRRVYGARDADESGQAGECDPGDISHDPRQLALFTEFHEQVEKLATDERRVFELSYYGGLTQAETAQVMGLHPRKVSRLWFSATQHLAEWADVLRGPA
jgi:RNA polymerase sigma factor (sigma-70 family)